MVEIIDIPGVSVMDLVNHRDVGNGQYFWHIRASRKECNTIVQDLVNRNILVPMSNEEINEALANIKQREYFEILLTEKRYKIATEVLGRYISDWDTVYHFVAIWIEGNTDPKSPSRSREASDLYEYCVGHVRMVNLPNKLGIEHQQMLKSMEEEENRRTKPPLKGSVVTHEKEEEVKNEKFDPIKCIKEKLEEMRDNPEYIEIRSKFPILYEIFMKPLRDVLEKLDMKDSARH